MEQKTFIRHDYVSHLCAEFEKLNLGTESRMVATQYMGVCRRDPIAVDQRIKYFNYV